MMHMVWFLLGFGAAGAASLVTTAVAMKLAHRFGWLDEPSARGLHHEATLSRGGLGFVLVSAPGLAFALIHSGLEPLQSSLLVGAGLGIALMGFIDDAHPLPVLPRLGFQFLMAAGAVWLLQPMTLLPALPPSLVLVAAVLGTIAWVWSINLFNFMDGVDGLVAAGVVCMALTLAGLAALGGYDSVVLAWAVLAGACTGFLPWNWPPARMFMGDVGSGYLGYVIALLALFSIQVGAVTIWSVLIVGAPFLVDTAFTLLRRMLRGERWYQAHRQHAYQKLVLRTGTHRPVTLLLVGIQVAVMAPLALWAHFTPDLAPVLAGVVGLILAYAAWRIGAGTPEPRPDRH